YFYTRATCAVDQNVDIGEGDQFYESKNLLHSFRFGDDSVESLFGLAIVRVKALLKVITVQRALNHYFDFFQINWLRVIIEGSQTEGSHDIILIVIHCDYNHPSKVFFG